MGEGLEHSELVTGAQAGNGDCREQLAVLVRQRLGRYLYRVTLDYDLSHDLMQETVLEMLRFLGKLRQRDRFWPWVYGIAENKLKLYYRRKSRSRNVDRSKIPPGKFEQDSTSREAVQEAVGNELREIVASAMASLNPRYRAVLAMRCYDEMNYDAIAEAMDCSKMGARVIFYRAKKSLQKQLSKKGLGKGAILTALVLFGKMTAPAKAAGLLTVKASTLKVGAGAGLVGAVTAKKFLATAAAVAVTAAGFTVCETMMNGTASGSGESAPWQQYYPETARAEQPGQKWFFFPRGADSAVIMRIMWADGNCEYLQNECGNYYYDCGKGVLTINNFRRFSRNLSTILLPTDSQRMRDFVRSVEGRPTPKALLGNLPAGSVVIEEPDGSIDILHNYNLLEEEHFRYNWPARAKVVDNRDKMRQRGWAYFTIRGRLGDSEIKGEGRMPFFYSYLESHGPWLRIKADGRLRAIDCEGGSAVYDQNGTIISAGHAGQLFAFLGRPWRGMHLMDSIRRAAANAGIWYSTRLIDAGSKVEVTLETAGADLIYVIDIERDVLDCLRFVGEHESGPGAEGELIFSYLQDEQRGARFSQPTFKGHGRQRSAFLWPLELAK